MIRVLRSVVHIRVSHLSLYHISYSCPRCSLMPFCMHVMSVDATVQPEKKPNTLRNKVITRGRNASGTSFGCETRSTIHSYITLSHQRHGRCFSSLLMGRENTLSGPDRLLSWPPYRTANAQALGLLESFLGKRSIVQAKNKRSGSSMVPGFASYYQNFIKHCRCGVEGKEHNFMIS